MFDYTQDQELDELHDKAFATCLDLQSVAIEIGVDISFCQIDQTMETDQLATIQGMIEQAIAKADEEAQEKLRQMGRCPMGFKWNREGHGWRCEGGSHFISGAEVEKYLL